MEVDRRVHSRGLNAGGLAHRPGWIAFRSSTTQSNLFRGVDIAPRPLANGKYLAVAIDRVTGTVVVVQGVGTAKPKVVGALQDDALIGPSDYGNGGIAFPPASRDRALILTQTGFAVLTLHDPSAPRLKAVTTLGDGLTQPTGIAVSNDGDHLAVSAGPTVYGFSGVRRPHPRHAVRRADVLQPQLGRRRARQRRWLHRQGHAGRPARTRRPAGGLAPHPGQERPRRPPRGQGLDQDKPARSDRQPLGLADVLVDCCRKSGDPDQVPSGSVN